MNLVKLDIRGIRLGQPLPFSLRSSEGVLLAAKGYTVKSREELQTMLERGRTLCIDAAESGEHLRAYMAQLHNAVRDEKSLGEIAGMQVTDVDAAARPVFVAPSGKTDWPDLQSRAATLLRPRPPAAHQRSDFLDRVHTFHAELTWHALRTPDATLFALIYLSASELQLYSATHAMLVSVVCGMAGREVLNWPAPMVESVSKAALTMNLGMTELQDHLAQQVEPLTAEQVRQIEQHADVSVQMLEQHGVTDPLWLEAVRHHHVRTPGPLAPRSPALQMARLIQRADMFAARMSPRINRAPMSPSAAMQASYFDEEKKVDEAGASLIKAVGVYPPGSFVKLASSELAAVVRRGPNSTTPRVAVIVNRQGMPTGEAMVRDTSQITFKIQGSVAHRDIKVQLQLDRLLALI